ncbi:MAG: aminomethyl transferase family protein [Proteobacteria bacterium]|nr:aminomethyl transferase family protein [Pseudomonadota bacterium]MCP4922340.1 aminomethyl transferase family protein [Pseudomonadota bacterium]
MDEALRQRATVRRADHVAVVRVRGDQAYDLLDAVSPRPLFVRDGQVLHTVFLSDAGHVLADVYIAVDDLDYLLLVEGLTAPQLVEWLEPHAADLDVELVDHTDSHGIVSVDGPYAWELVARLVSPDVLGVPYLCFFDAPGWGLCFRGGKTGEYGYDFLVERSRMDELAARLRELSADMDPGEPDLDALDRCALENGFYSVRLPEMRSLGPMELQLQWRIDPRRKAPGMDAVRAARADGVPRISWIVGDTLAEPGPVTGDADGRLLFTMWSTTLGRAIGLALLERDRAHPGLTLDAGGLTFTTCSAPLLTNRSLFIDTQRHSWASRDTDTFPPIAG